jgi:hypothetical protein
LVVPRGAFGPLIVLGMVLLVGAAGLCLLDGHEASGIDRCALPLALTLIVPVAITLPLTGRSLPALVTSRPSYAPDLPAPPPKA